MELQAKLQEETNERKNALEAYIYSLRNKLSAEYEQYITVSDKEALHNRLMQMEVGQPLSSLLRCSARHVMISCCGALTLLLLMLAHTGSRFAVELRVSLPMSDLMAVT